MTKLVDYVVVCCFILCRSLCCCFVTHWHPVIVAATSKCFFFPLLLSFFFGNTLCRSTCLNIARFPPRLCTGFRLHVCSPPGSHGSGRRGTAVDSADSEQNGSAESLAVWQRAPQLVLHKRTRRRIHRETRVEGFYLLCCAGRKQIKKNFPFFFALSGDSVHL